MKKATEIMLIISSADTWCEQKKSKKKIYAMKTSMVMCNYFYNIYVIQPIFYSLRLRPLNCCPL